MKQHDVFISYSRADYVNRETHQELADNVISKLMGAFDEAGITYWIDKEGIHSGDAWAKLIGKAIGDAAVFLFVSSANSNRSDCWSADEIALARNKKKHIIPFLLDDTPFNDEFALFIARLDYVDYATIGDAAIPKLVESIELVLDAKDPNRKKIRELKKQQSALRDEIKRKESERRHVISQLKELGADVNDELAIDAEEVKRLKRELVEKEKELNNLHQQNVGLQAEKEKLMAQNKKLEASLKEVTDELSDERKRRLNEIKLKLDEIQRLEKTCKEKDNQIAELKADVVRLSEYERREKERRAEAERQEAEQKRRAEEEEKRKRSNMVWFDENSYSLRWRDKEYKMIQVAGGTFTMGATSEQSSDADKDEKPAHKVTLSNYCIGQTAVPQWLWQAAMGNNPGYFKGENRPVESVSWDDCQDFIKKLNNLTGKAFVLPTEAQWEYAARGGSKSKGYKYSGNNNIDEVAWYNGNSNRESHDVATKKPNELGIYDMSGNVWEWCQDLYGSYSSAAATNPSGPSSGSYRVIRGGGWYFNATHCRVSFRNSITPDRRFNFIGLRLAL